MYVTLMHVHSLLQPRFCTRLVLRNVIVVYVWMREREIEREKPADRGMIGASGSVHCNLKTIHEIKTLTT